MINNEQFDQDILGKLKEKKATPKPKWHFLLKNYIIWACGIFSMVVGGLAFSVIIYLLQYNDWSIYKQINGGFLKFIFLTLPYFWLLFLTFFILIINYDIKHTKKGYRYPIFVIVAFSIIISIVLGGLFFKVGLSQAIDDVLGERAPFYEKIFNRQAEFWSQPQEGRLAGLVLSKQDNSNFIVLDIDKKEWIVSYENKSNILPFEIQVGKPIRLIGEKISDNAFHADKIMPVGPGRGFFMRGKDKHLKRFREDQKMREKLQDIPEPKERLNRFHKNFKEI